MEWDNFKTTLNLLKVLPTFQKFNLVSSTLADPGSQFFRFDIQILRNIAILGVGTRSPRLAPPMGNLGSATVIRYFDNRCNSQNVYK